jgi:hypothetical protein
VDAAAKSSTKTAICFAFGALSGGMLWLFGEFHAEYDDRIAGSIGISSNALDKPRNRNCFI